MGGWVGGGVCERERERESCAVQVISGKKKPVVRRTSLGVAGLAEEEEWEGPVRGGGGGGGMVRVEERADLAAEIGSVVSGLTEFKAELLQLHAIVSSQPASLV